MSGYEFEGVGPHEEAVRISGRVKWFDAGKGYGFVVPDDPNQTGLKDVLLHVTSLRNSGRESALEGAVIVCDVIRRPKGWQVAEVLEVDESSAPPPSDRRRHDEGHQGRSFDRGGFGARPQRRPLTPQGPLERAKVKCQPSQGLRLRSQGRGERRHLRAHRNPAPIRYRGPAAGR